MIFPGTAPLGQFLIVRPMPLQVVEQVAQTVLPKRAAPLLGAFAFHNDQAVFAVEITGAQPTQLGQADAGVVEYPEDGPVACWSAIGQGTDSPRRGGGRRQG